MLPSFRPWAIAEAFYAAVRADLERR